MKRIVNLGLIIGIMIIFATFSVSAIDEDKSYDDPEEDVIDFTNYDPSGEEVYTDEKPNIDIKKSIIYDPG